MKFLEPHEPVSRGETACALEQLEAIGLRAFDTGEIPAFVVDLDPADLVLEDGAGLAMPPEPPTLRWLPGSERGRPHRP